MVAIANEPPDWVFATSGTRFGPVLAFPGCAPTETGPTQQVRKVALMQALANIAKARQVKISGTERLEIEGEGARYFNTITEEVEGRLRPVTVIEEKVVVIDDLTHLCVLAGEEER